MPVDDPCPIGGEYKGQSPVRDEDRPGIWKWARDNTDFKTYEGTAKAINDYFFGGRAPNDWIRDIIGGRKTPFREITTEMWQKNYDRQKVVAYARELNRHAGTSNWEVLAKAGWNVWRGIETMGHGIVFPISHGGDLIFRPSSWRTYFRGIGDVYGGAFNQQHAINRMGDMQRDALFPLALESGVDAGPGSKAMGILGGESQFAERFGDVPVVGQIINLAERAGQLPVLRRLVGSAGRAWDMLGVTRFEMWKAAMKGHIKEGMSHAELLDYGKEFAEWANDATGAGKGKIANIGGETLFGPKLTQSKINRLYQIGNTPWNFANWRTLTPGQKAVAWQRLSGATQYVTTRLGMLAVNQGILSASGSDQKINWFDPNKSDYMQFKGFGLELGIPGMMTELRALARVLSLSYWEYVPDSKKIQLAKVFGPAFTQQPRETGVRAVYDIGKDWLTGKFHPAIERSAEFVSGRTFTGRPLPWSQRPGTEEKPRMETKEYLATIGPIPLQGPLKYVYDRLKETGATASEAVEITKGLIIAGFGATGAHVREEPKPVTKGPRRRSIGPRKPPKPPQPAQVPH